MKGTSPSFRMITLGCKVNQYESAFLSESLVEYGFLRAPDNERADIVIINTCTVTGTASKQSRQSIRKAIKENPGAFVAAVGCYVQAFPEELGQIEGISLLTGNNDKKDLPFLIRKAFQENLSKNHTRPFHAGQAFEQMPVRLFAGRARAFLKIQDGCEAFCSYCIVPKARGPSRSLDPEKAVSVMEEMAVHGICEVVLTGIHLGRYGRDLSPKISLASLLRKVTERRLPLRIRLSSIEPNEIDDEIIGLVRKEPCICPHFHIPLQSGDDAILRCMNRHYSTDQFESLIENIRSRIPFCAIGVDVISGFPGESEKAFMNTFSLIRSLPITYLHVFPFSPRKGTPAASFAGRVEPADIRARTGLLRALGREKRDAFHKSFLGKTLEVVSEGISKEEEDLLCGTSDNYIPVLFVPLDSKAADGIKMVKAACLRGQKVLGKEITCPYPV
ncbi:MAG: tRNA (N(6)-L-threonylcarbamoyladenosine(37)-C(2))-methylthiotransferase MtaB [Deltaproteobacteria bacterium CG_4_8_14_3_um_filter_51_11]|nr:tRNA (N(6)-L-threonylcarbamoyladenosine(37)-C(2))-methylthiotransferase MtaB [bacterium]OIP39826.1 MAG: tRNA (N(6)-L-threonylcarbamoyladenosine(37)-C(2))-methylthiotransferase MtaB [Desulfobacteraceae bacterium CG2_30_51_40]PIP47288.1 MAG: tRNA (N(6)-L-threonylcarbamoyladenosine(37)-C(2))-methylthiotransferase MtaB [Deltaproteobacteria bacterium CG23_combo_of_CG06-09_8_20_14_all_51_20]PIX19475.1 MAG: tRNA (N(6)-L-threonylcarbamoyladenosine(37)-C(2))-methylthiotransferase MtaB [Deltaproteobact